ncbi:MAG: hypothetical protein KatS3mg031_2013 [Chitinophagales bacterium]|nr:MAG: hypothetical protein KatS3mg031_2013 [Chitinophagales bacterium]
MRDAFLLVFFLLICGCHDRAMVQLDRLPYAPDNSLVRIEKFVQNCYIQLLGRKADSGETAYWNAQLKDSRLSYASAERLIDSLLRHPEYRQHQYLLARNELMNFIFNPDSAEIEKTIKIWEEAERNEAGRKEISRLRALQAIPRDLLTGNLDNIGLHKRLVHNSYYDFINMGTENFVVSMYHNFLDRNPTTFELEQGKKMVDGFPAILDYQSGASKEDFINLFFESYAYFEGQVRKAFLRLLYREPTPEESVFFTLQYKKNRNYEQLLKSLLLYETFKQP